MNGVQLYVIVHFGGDIICPKIGSIVSYVGGSMKLTSLREHSSYEDFVTLLEETSEIYCENCKMYNFVHGCKCTISPVQNFTVMINMHKTNPGIPFHIWIVNDLRVPFQNSQNFIFDFCSLGKGLSTTKDTGSGKRLSTTKVGGPLPHNSFPDPELEYRGCPETSGRGLDPRRFEPFVDDDDVPQSNDSFKTIRTDVSPSNELSIPQSNVHLLNEPVLTNVPQSNEPFQTIPTNVPFSNEPCISQSSIHLSNEIVLTNVPSSNEPMLTNVPLSIEPKPIIGQTKTSGKFAEFVICVLYFNISYSISIMLSRIFLICSAEFRFEPQPEQVKNLLNFWFKSAAYIEDPYDFSKEFNIGDLYRDRIELKNHIRAYAVVNKFNLVHVLSKEYKIVMCGSFEHAYQLLTCYFEEVRLVDPDFVFDIQTTSCKNKRFTRCFWCFGPPEKTYKLLRPVVVIGQTFLKGRYCGTLLTAITIVPNNHIFLLAFSIIDSETTES
ncbi:hypothetical protein GIB67_002523 [Kingdonia uniflora]|uniref:Uncharacterized protein n=1 Tax=Kingdonia uniflora TaxID=39325 RepID=A0A7J7N9F3_9MAGN|nr:hypothetical protein GIB67_002523 [Kingdonia uniflora]